jgi:diguanylate cyclase (GGDEF)-like protein/PAS domain S-box-containing protein
VIDGSSDLPSVYTDICRIAVDLGGLTMAWIGKPEPAQERIVPVASYGSGTDFLNGILISTRADVPEGCGPTGTAYRENRTTFNHNFQTDPSIGPWRGRSIPFNWQSCASFPVRCASQVVALLVVYSTEPNAFDPEEVALLEKLSANLSQAADAMEVAKQQRQLALQLRQSEETYRTLFETVQQGVVFQNLQGEIISANPAAERILGLSLSQMQGRTSLDPRWRTIRPDGSDFPGSEHPAMRALATGQAVNGVTMGIHLPESGTPVWISVNAKPVRNKETGALEYVYAVFDNITETVRLQSELEAQANRDFLTDVANRRHFFALANQELARATRYQSPMSMLMLDIDYFKAVNDTHGHAVGDQVLKMVAQVCKAALREVDVLGRIGGEEFAVLLPQTAGGMALDVAERIRIAVGQAKVEGGANGAFVSVAVSVGVSTRQTDEDTVDSLLQAADTALYKAKNSGRNRVCSAF